MCTGLGFGNPKSDVVGEGGEEAGAGCRAVGRKHLVDYRAPRPPIHFFCGLATRSFGPGRSAVGFRLFLTDETTVGKTGARRDP